jgi:hypothetical protein
MTQLAAIFDDDPSVIAAHKLARDAFEAMATNHPSDPQPTDPIDAIQLALMRWQRAKFGDQIDERMALGIIEEMAETFLSDAPPLAEQALDGLGDVCVYAAQLCTSNRLALSPLLDLARMLTRRQNTAKLLPVAYGVLAQTVLKGSQKIRGLDDVQRFRLRLIGSLALCIAKAIDDVEIMHDVKVRAGEVLLVVAREVLARGAGHDAIPKAVKPETTMQLTAEQIEQHKADRQANALGKMAGVLEGYDPDVDPPATPSDEIAR